MKTAITILLVAMFLAVIVPAGLGCAGTPAEVGTAPDAVAGSTSESEISGTMERTQHDMDPNPKTENNEMIFENNTDYWDVHGDLEGTIISEYRLVANTLTGKFTIEGQATFTGTMDGKQGDSVSDWTGNGQVTSPTGESGIIDCEMIMINGTGDLTDLRGNLTSHFNYNNTGCTGTYSGMVKFEK